MSNWRIIDNTYVYDGTFEGFLTIVFKCLQLKSVPREIMAEIYYEDNILDIPVLIETKTNEAKKMFNEINNISNYSLFKVYNSFLSGNKDKDNIILKYILLLFKYRNKLDFMGNNTWVIELNKLNDRVMKEAHRLKGFLRFKELSYNILWACIEPENNVIEILSKHFKDRLKMERWIIYDKKRNIASVYENNKYIIGTLSEVNLKDINENSNETIYSNLWKDYFNNISIKERKNLKCQMNFMPKKYWKYLTEMEEKK